MINAEYGVFGIKGDGVSLENNFEDFINRANEYIIAGSYSYRFPRNVYYRLRNKSRNGCACGIIMPYTINRLSDINALIYNNVGVIIKESNHSKFLLSERDLYLGSANLTNGGINNNTEVVVILNDYHHVQERSDFINYTLNQINNFMSITNQYQQFDRHNQDIINNLNTVFNYVLRLNPNVTKVKKTVDNYGKCNSIIMNSIDTYFALLSIKDFNKISKKLSDLRMSLSKLVEYGYYNILFEFQDKNIDLEEVKISDSKIKRYNKLWSNFQINLEIAINYIKNINDKISLPRDKDKLVSQNEELIKLVQEKLLNELKMYK